MGDIKVSHNRLEKKFSCIVHGKECKVEYDLPEKDVMEIYHTFVPQELRGQGIAKELYTEIIKYIDENHFKVIPTCSYALKIFSQEQFRKYLKR